MYVYGKDVSILEVKGDLAGLFHVEKHPDNSHEPFRYQSFNSSVAFSPSSMIRLATCSAIS
jgi:hypothetical protein